MKRLLILCAVALSLGGCANVKTAFDVATTPVTITEATVYKVENGLKTATAGLVAYRRLCIKKVIDPVKLPHGVIESIQPYTIAAAFAIADMRAAVKANNQVNALAAYSMLQGLITNIQNQRQRAGVI
jgi:uncharacterized protein YceK